MSGFKVLDEDSVVTLRSLSKSAPKDVLNNFGSIDRTLNKVNWLPNPLAEVKLMLPDSTSNYDKQNSISIYNAFNFLSPVLASDERIWVTLTFCNFSEYTNARWLMPSQDDTDLTKNLLNHWFALTARDRWRNNSISRLWWIGQFVENLENIKKDDAYEILYYNSDLLTSFLGRSTLASYKNIASSVIRVTHKYYFSGDQRKFDRDSFRDFLKLIDLRLGKTAIGSFEQELCDEVIFSLFAQTH
jgi:hypothetical protein